MIDIKDIEVGKSYACKFKAKVMVDDLGRPAPNLSDRPLGGIKDYEGIGVLLKRDLNNKLVELQDEKSEQIFVVPFEDIWDIDTVEWDEK